MLGARLTLKALDGTVQTIPWERQEHQVTGWAWRLHRADAATRADECARGARDRRVRCQMGTLSSRGRQAVQEARQRTGDD